MSKIYINVSGGCVQGVLSTNKNDKVELWDWDNIKAENENIKDLETEWDGMCKRLHSIF